MPFVPPIVSMGGVIASTNHMMQQARKRREREETPSPCREEGKTCAHCDKCACENRGKGTA
jgi:hypothetical protein